MLENNKLKEECAVFGASTTTMEAAGITHNGLLSLQHRGQEGAGIAVLSDNTIHIHKGEGLVAEVFSSITTLHNLPASNMAVGHTRYSTTGNKSVRNVQPFLTEYLTGRIATAHNGNIANVKEIRDKLSLCGIHFSASSDSEVISSLIAYNIVRTGNVVEGVISAAKELKGAFCLIVMSSDNKLIAIRDPRGYRPLCIGQSDLGTVVASESCALDTCGFSFVRDVMPGEVIVIENGKITESSIPLTSPSKGICIFEYVYFARPDSIIDNLSVYEARYNMGRILAKEYPVDADVVCGVPDSGLEAAMGYASESGLPLVSGFVKNRYVGRSFIFPTQSERETAVKIKLNPLKKNIENKRIVLVDDSIVRGTTCAKIIRLLKAAGAKEVHMRVSSPPFKHTCYFGTDIGSEENLIANKLDIESIKQSLGLDSLGYISVEGLIKACEGCSLPFCTGCFTGDYNIEINKVFKTLFEVN